MRAARAFSLLIGAAIVTAAPVAATSEDSGSARARFDAQQRLEQRVQDIGWRLITGNARFCDNAAPAIGLMLHDMASYRDPAAVRHLLGLSGDFAVLAAAKGSPAADAGLSAGVQIRAIAGNRLDDWPAQAHSDWRRAIRAQELIDMQLRPEGWIRIERGDGRLVEVAGVPACASHFEIGGEGKGALAEGTRVIVERDFPGLEYPDDELAAALAHELAHNLLHHRAWLEHEGRKRRNIRLTEREADRLMPWLLANAGYDPSAALRFMERWGPQHSGGIFRKRSHDGWDERAEFIAAELQMIEAVRSEDGQADWRNRFKRDVRPEN